MSSPAGEIRGDSSEGDGGGDISDSVRLDVESVGDGNDPSPIPSTVDGNGGISILARIGEVGFARSEGCMLPVGRAGRRGVKSSVNLGD